MTDSEKLAACPWCRLQDCAISWTGKIGASRAYIACDCCLMRGPEALSGEKAVAAWNAIPRPTPAGEMVRLEDVKEWLPIDDYARSGAPVLIRSRDDHNTMAVATWDEEAGPNLSEHCWSTIDGYYHRDVFDAYMPIPPTAPTGGEERLREALEGLVNAKALSGVRELVAGWNGENRPEGPHASRHPDNLGATLPKTNCGAVYALDEAMQRARAALQSTGER